MSVLMSWVLVGLMAWFVVSAFFVIVFYVGQKPGHHK